MTRIAYVSSDLGVPVFGRKGCSNHVQEVVRAFLRLGAHVDLFTTNSEGERSDNLKEVEVHVLPRPPKGEQAARERAALAGNANLREELERAGPFDFVYERYSLWSHAAMDYARAKGIPGLLEVNAPLIDEQAKYRVLVDRASAERVAAHVFDTATAVAAVSEEVGAWVEGFPGARGKVTVIPNGVSPERFPANPKRALPAAPGTFTVGFVGTLKAWHGLSVLVDAFTTMRSRVPGSRLLIVGDGPERENITASLAARGFQESAVFTGAVAPAEVPAFLACMDVAVAPYPQLEQFYFSPLKVYEYMAAAVPVVASSIGQLNDLIVPEVNGLLVRPGDPEALANALQRLYQEPTLRARLGSTGRSTVLSQYTWEGVARRIFSLARIKLTLGEGETAQQNGTAHGTA